MATLNGTLCAMTRTIIMILENHQQADGSGSASRKHSARCSVGVKHSFPSGADRT